MSGGRGGRLFALPVAFEVDVAVGVVSVAGGEASLGELCFALVDHIGVAAEEDVGGVGGEGSVGEGLEHVGFEDDVDAAAEAVPVALGRFACAGGEVDDGGVLVGDVFESIAVAQVGGESCAVDDDEAVPAVGVAVGLEHGDEGGEAGTGGDGDEGFFGGDVVEGEGAFAGFIHEESVALPEAPEIWSESAFGDDDEVELGAAGVAGGGGDGVGPAEEAGTADFGAFGWLCVGVGRGQDTQGGVLTGGEVEGLA